LKHGYALKYQIVGKQAQVYVENIEEFPCCISYCLTMKTKLLFANKKEFPGATS
jgi:hypothetical protein